MKVKRVKEEIEKFVKRRTVVSSDQVLQHINSVYRHGTLMGIVTNILSRSLVIQRVNNDHPAKWAHKDKVMQRHCRTCDGEVWYYRTNEPDNSNPMHPTKIWRCGNCGGQY